MEYQELEDYIFELRDEHLEFQVAIPGFIKPEEIEGFYEPVNKAFLDFQGQYRLPALQGVRKFWEGPFPEQIHAIRSMVGDDETITNNCLIYAVLCVVIGPRLSRIKISWKDVQFNKDLYNYAEGWVLIPPSADSGYESVSRYARGNGVPFVLDPIKFKNLSAVRKQSDMEVDLPSKFIQHENPQMNVRILGMNVIEFISYSASGFPRQQFGNQRDPKWLRTMKVHNPYTGLNQIVGGALLSAMRKEARFTWLCKDVSARVFYDYPNINRNLRRFSVEADTGLVQEKSGGFPDSREGRRGPLACYLRVK